MLRGELVDPSLGVAALVNADVGNGPWKQLLEEAVATTSSKSGA